MSSFDDISTHVWPYRYYLTMFQIIDGLCDDDLTTHRLFLMLNPPRGVVWKSTFPWFSKEMTWDSMIKPIMYELSKALYWTFGEDSTEPVCLYIPIDVYASPLNWTACSFDADMIAEPNPF